MLPPILIDDPGDGRVDDYRHLTDAELSRSQGHPDGLFIAEGLLVIRQLLRSAYPVRSLLLAAGKLDRLAADLETLPSTVAVYVAAPAVLCAVAGLNVHRGALASAARLPTPPATSVLTGARIVVVLEGINDHENLGAMFRNVAAFGGDAILLCPRSADPLYRRSVRVSLGNVLHVPFARLEPWPGALMALKAAGFRVLAMTPDPSAVPIDRIDGLAPLAAAGAAAPPRSDGSGSTVDRPRTALLLGAEGPGLSEEALAAADLCVRIPMARGVDSLNVSTAAAIALHRLTALGDG
ncbi:MAG TPA: RNA methyltransferase [Acidimicrobiales bacterium]|nr:RNA methyltransferase [Acidimicrobiales bacterium]